MTAPYPDFDGTQSCAGVDPDMFFDSRVARSMTAREVATAVAVCASCSWRTPCGAYALTHDVHGIWAGTTEPTRREIRQRHGITARPLELSDTATRAEEVRHLAASGTPPRLIAEQLGIWQETVYRILGRTPA